jgi:hypothetical protein
MFRKRRRKPRTTDGVQQDAPAAAAAPAGGAPAPAVPRAPQKPKAQPPANEAFRTAIEKASERAKTELAAKGKLDTMVFFAHEDGAMKMANLIMRDGQQKEVLIQRIKEKAHAENAFAVMVLNETDPKRHKVVLTAVTPGAKTSVHLDYAYDAKTKTVTSWDLKWQHQTPPNPFIDGIFNTKS